VWAQVPNGHSLLSVLPDPLDTLSKLPAVTVPLLVMHGEQDNIVPVAQGLRCYEVRQGARAGWRVSVRPAPPVGCTSSINQ
jgi:fermentation-respiration switch protein FrsA (DUF1100 family)